MLGALDPDQIEALLHREVIGRLGCYQAGRVYVVPITYAYDGRYVVSHTGEGMKLTFLRAHPRVCLEVDRLEDLAAWESVVAWGEFEELHGADAARAREALQARLAQLTPGKCAAPGPESVLYRIELHEKTGRFERPGPGRA